MRLNFSVFTARPDGWSAEHEARFRTERIEGGVLRARWAIALILLVMLLPLGELPKMRVDRTPEQLSGFLWLRFAGVSPIIFLMLAVTFVKSLRPWLSFISGLGLALSCTVLAISVQVLNPVVVSPFGRLTASTVPLMIAGVMLLPLTLRSAVLSTLGVSIGTFTVMWFMSHPMPEAFLMLNAGVVLVSLGAAVSIAVAYRENAAREVFMQRERLAELNLELRATNERLAQVSGQKSDFLAMAAHELRSPLLVASLTAEQLRNKAEPTHDELDEGLALIGDVLTRMNDVLASFLQSQAALDRSLARNDQAVRLEDAASAAIRRAEPIISRKQQSVRLVPSTSGPVARGDASLVGQVLDNLLSNASKFSPAGSAIDVRVLADAAAGRGSIAVSDAGPGLTDEDQTHLFQKYSRLSAKPTAGESSTGLGLSIVKLLMEAMGGEVKCESRAGAGATFWIHLPLSGSSSDFRTPV